MNTHNNRRTALVLCILATLCCFLLTGCDKGQPETAEKEEFSIVCTVYPVYDWVKNITEGVDNVSVKLVVDTGADLHSYQPSAKDVLTMTQSDVLVYIGGVSDSWAGDAARQSEEQSLTPVNLLELLGNQQALEHANVHLKEHEQGQEHEHALPAGPIDYLKEDEHIWMSLKNAQILTQKLSDILAQKDAVHAQAYAENAKAYGKTLQKLDAAYADTVKNAGVDTVIVADRFPFVHLFNDYGIRYLAAFPGCSAESEASFDTVLALAKAVDEKGLHHICVTESAVSDVADAVIANSKTKDLTVVTLNSLQSVTARQIQNGISYVSAMQQNLAALKTLLEA